MARSAIRDVDFELRDRRDEYNRLVPEANASWSQQGINVFAPMNELSDARAAAVFTHELVHSQTTKEGLAYAAQVAVLDEMRGNSSSAHQSRDISAGINNIVLNFDRSWAKGAGVLAEWNALSSAKKSGDASLVQLRTRALENALIQRGTETLRRLAQ